MKETTYRSFFSSQIAMAREAKGLSLSQAAKAAGITKAHLHDLEAGRSNNPGARTIHGLSKVLDLTPATLINAAVKDFESEALAQSIGGKDD